MGLLFPAPLPLGLGQVGERLRETLAGWLEDVPWAEAVYALLASPPPADTALRPLTETLIVAGDHITDREVAAGHVHLRGEGGLLGPPGQGPDGQPLSDELGDDAQAAGL